MRIERLITFACAVCFASWVAGSALADNDEGGNRNALLKGDYRFTLNKTCAEVREGITDFPYFRAMGDGNQIELFINGIGTFDGIGHVMFKERGIIIHPGPYSIGSATIGPFEETCTGPYAVKRNGSFSFEVDCTEINGGYTVRNVKVVGQISAGGLVLITYSLVPPRIETIEFVENGNLVSNPRLCGQVGTHVRIRPN